MKLSIHPLAEPLSTGATAAAAAPLDQRLILRLRVSLARLLGKGDELAKAFYAMLFERYPSVRPLFPADMAAQRVKLTEMLAWIATGLDHPDQTLPAIADLGRRHAGYGARPEHYPLVRDTLVEAMGRTAGADWDEELAEDWRQSIDLIARHMLAASGAPAGPAAATAVAAPGNPTATGPR
jgi:hemoglobin-like flavoprotein